MNPHTHNPWAGLESYQTPETTGNSLKFCGRDNESYDVAQLIDDNIFVTLYGKSGTGKTSLLNAGVFPRLREEQYLSISIRLGMEAMNCSFQECIRSKLIESMEGCGHITTINVVPLPSDEQAIEFLWSLFARTRFTDLDGRPLFPVLVFDQFEEVFRKRRKDADTLLRQIYFMMDESHALSNRMVNGQLYTYDFNFRFVLSIREDALYCLEDSIDNCYLANMKRCRYRLRSLSEQFAREVILIPGEGLFRADEQEQIVNTIIQIARNKDDQSINTSILSLVCNRIFVDYQRLGTDYITLSLVETFIKGNPFERFYNEATRSFSTLEKYYIENHLVDEAGHRNSIPVDDFLTQVKHGAQLLTGNKRILQCSSTSIDGVNCRIELIHDAFCEPLKCQKEKREKQIHLWQMGILFFLTLMIISGALFIYHNIKSEKDKIMVVQSRFLAEKVIGLSDKGEYRLASLLAVEALPNKLQKPNRPYTLEAEVALRSTSVLNNNVLGKHQQPANCAVFSPDGMHIVSTSDDATIRIWHTQEEEPHILSLLTPAIWFAAFSPDSHMIACASNDGTIRLTTISGEHWIKTIPNHSSPVFMVAFSPDGKHLASASADNKIRIWDIKDGNCIQTLQGHSERVKSVAFNSDGTEIVSTGDDKIIRIWNTATGECIHALIGHEAKVNCASFSPDGHFVISASLDKSIRIWDLLNEECILTLSGHTDDVKSAMVSPDGHYIVSASHDKSIRLWDFNSGTCLQVQTTSSWINYAAFSPDGRHIVSASWDGTVRIWDFPPLQELIDKTRERFKNQPLTPEEKRKYYLE